MLDIIKNTYPKIKTTVTINTPFCGACPHSGEPQEGSYISVTYQPREYLIDIHAVEKYLAELSKGSNPLDLETVCHLVLTACTEVVDDVSVKAVYKLRGGLELICKT